MNQNINSLGLLVDNVLQNMRYVNDTMENMHTDIKTNIAEGRPSNREDRMMSTSTFSPLRDRRNSNPTLHNVPNCRRRCGRIWSPVCGTNGQTYSSSCHLGVAACRYPDKKISTAHEG